MSRSNKRPPCQICETTESKYTCSSCLIVYCSVPCYKTHKASSCAAASQASRGSLLPLHEPAVPPPQQTVSSEPIEEEPLDDPKPLRPLSSLKWPYVPEASAYPDPLERDDPKPLQTQQYEALATSPKIRQVLAEHPNLPALLTSIDQLRGHERDRALQKALGVSDPQVFGRNKATELEDDVLALRALAEAVESAVRGEQPGQLGLDWGDDT
ncbi:hypothetical protein CYLTODRAFT_386949 [Cylindrobasidium torrendii FP15055 ss-10]|uniref:HIT-type domain-containing protein n=1 Tax=Cylindrobasidium torrendii FP15055 ss-10 TaxID=1314674 RepID=A0A0D7BT57_9AGAR|nr:hypothetical protein CYLTODRAFT_386949 [Cylindrobasidium torrendii FP15055 ss-10]